MATYYYGDDFDNLHWLHCADLEQSILEARSEDWPAGLVSADILRKCLQSSSEDKVTMVEDFLDWCDLQKIFTCLLVGLIPTRFIAESAYPNIRNALGMIVAVIPSMVALHGLGVIDFFHSSAALTSCILGEFFLLHGEDMLIIYSEWATTSLRLDIMHLDTFNDLADDLFPETNLIPYIVLHGSLSIIYWMYFPEAAFFSGVSLRGISLLNMILAIMDCLDFAIHLILVGMHNYWAYQRNPLLRRWG